MLLWALPALAPWGSLAGQGVFPEANGAALAGVAAVDAQVLVLNWLDVGEDRDRFQAHAESAFEAALRSDGMIVGRDAPNSLFCELKVAEIASRSIVYSWAIGYYEFVIAGAHRLQWTTGGIVRMGSSNFSGQAAIEECADRFRQEWLRWNPR